MKNTNDYKEFMKDFFEKYYEKYKEWLQLPYVPKDMLAEEGAPNEEWNRWKLIPAEISDEDINELENKVGVELPNILKSFLTTYFHLFEYPVGRNSSEEPFEAVYNAWNPLLVKVGYLPFTWDSEGYFIRCIDLKNMPDEDSCTICQIDHEILFDFDEENTNREDIEPKMQQIADNFIEYLEQLLEDEV